MSIKLNKIANAVFMALSVTATFTAPLCAQQANTNTSQAQSAPVPYIAPAGAPDPNDISSATSADSETSVFVGGTPIMRVRYPSGGFTPQQRARAIQQRVNRLLGQGPIEPVDITVEDIDSTDAAVYVKGQLLFTADQATARYNQSTVHDLASKWASTMRRVLPSLTRPA